MQTDTATRNEKMDVAELINSAAPRLKGKREAYVMLCNLIGGMNDDILDKYGKETAGALLRYFETNPKARAGKDAFAWVAQATSTDDTRMMINVVNYDGENVVATDGRRLHIMPNTDGKKGFYSKQGQAEKYEYTFPNYKQIIPDTTGRERVELKLSALTVDHVSQGLDICVIGGGLYVLAYIKEALAFDKEAVAFIPPMDDKGIPEGPIALEMREGRKAYIMPRRKA